MGLVYTMELILPCGFSNLFIFRDFLLILLVQKKAQIVEYWHLNVNNWRLGRIAQLVEHLSYTQAVIGSSPFAPNKYKLRE